MNDEEKHTESKVYDINIPNRFLTFSLKFVSGIGLFA